MGVTSLWDVLSGVSCDVDIEEIKGEVIAIDLATWICQAEGVALMKQTVQKPYLRNLIFRVIKLTCLGIKLIFVADGTPPKIKQATIANRINNRTDKKATGLTRRGLDSKLKECCALLDVLGIPWVKCDGEAEATCATFNMDGVVDACSTVDSDAFLYGATRLYRNLTAEKGVQVSCYEMKTVSQKLKLNRNDLIALALILGCDYCDGVPGVGKVSAMKWINWCKCCGEDSLARLRRLKDLPVKSGVKKPPHCSLCKHVGLKREHDRDECSICGSLCREGLATSRPCRCTWHVDNESKKETDIECKLTRHAKEVSDFPSEDVINEFLRTRSNKQLSSPRAPSLADACHLASSKLGWTIRYCVEKVLPLLTHWILLNGCQDKAEIEAEKIVRTRTRNATPMFEVEWKLSSIPSASSQLTIERQDLVRQRFPELVAEFETTLESKKAKKKGRNNKSKVEATRSTKITDHFTKKKPLEKPATSKSTDVDCLVAPLSLIKLDGNSEDDPVPQSRLQLSDQNRYFAAERESPEVIVIESGTSLSCENDVAWNCSRDLFDDASSSSSQKHRTTPEKENRNPLFVASSPVVVDDDGVRESPAFVTLAERIRLKSLHQ